MSTRCAEMEAVSADDDDCRADDAAEPTLAVVDAAVASPDASCMCVTSSAQVPAAAVHT